MFRQRSLLVTKSDSVSKSYIVNSPKSTAVQRITSEEILLFSESEDTSQTSHNTMHTK